MSDINKILNDIKSDLQETTLMAAGAKNKAERNEAQLGSLQSDLTLMQASLASITEELDDQINRSLRTTLIIKGVNEEPNESWEDTENILVKMLARHLSMHDEAQVAEMIERAHRGKKSSTSNGPRHIFARFYSWKDSEYVQSKYLSLNKANPKMKIKVHQMYSKRVTERRNAALLKRRDLMKNKTISNGYISYPATLMVKYSPSEKSYKKHEEF